MVFAALLFVLSLYAQETPAFDCAKLTAIGETVCRATIWCNWISSPAACVNDPCLKYVADSTPIAEACNYDDQSFKCGLYYLTDKHDCSNGQPIQSDRYCRSNNTVYAKDSMTACFYNDLKGQAAGTPTCPAPLCTVNDTSSSSGGAGRYCAETGADVCNTVFGSNEDFFCGCLGATYCKLYPGCQTVGTGCIPDPCYDYSAGASATGCGQNIPSAWSYCAPKKVNVLNAAKTGATTGYYCINNSRTDVNGCYDLQVITTTQGQYNYPECVVVTENADVCGTGVVFKDDDGTATNVQCSWVEIAGGFFSAAPQHYCTDGKRTVPSPTGSAGFVFRIPSVLALIAAAIFLL